MTDISKIADAENTEIAETNYYERYVNFDHAAYNARLAAAEAANAKYMTDNNIPTAADLFPADEE
jgi:hypothetical protein